MKTSINNLKEIFVKATKRVLKENLSTNPETISNNLQLITDSYNILITEIAKNWTLASEVDKKSLKEVFVYARSKVEKSYAVLNCRYYIPTNLYTLIDPSVIKVESESVEIENPSDVSSESDIFEDPSLKFKHSK